MREAVQLLEVSPESLSLRALARAAGVSAMAPYRHFPDKAALMRAVAVHGFEILETELERADAASDGMAALVAQGVAYVGFAVRRPALFRLMFRDHCPPDGSDTLGWNAYGVLARRVAGLRPDRRESATLAAWAIVHGLATLALDGRLSHDPAQAENVLSLFANGLRVA